MVNSRKSRFGIIVGQASQTDQVELQKVLKEKSDAFQPHFKPGFLQRSETIFQFRFDSGEPFYLYVSEDDFSFTVGIHEQPTVCLDVLDHKTCWGLLTGRLDGMQAFMEGLYRADGNIVLSQLLLYLFKSDDPTIAYEIQY